MKYVLATLAAFCLCAIALGPSAQAQQLPPGSYMQSCRDVGIDGGALTGICRTMNGAWQRTALGDIRQCEGDIGNSNGQLVCNRRNGALPAFGAGTPPQERRDLRLEQHQLRCEGIVDPLSRQRCFSRR